MAKTFNLWDSVQHFKQSEFDCPSEVGSGDNMWPRVVFMLDALRSLLGRPLPINSGYRTPAHNKAIGGAPKSAHMEGLAVDIGTRKLTKAQRQTLIAYAIQLGFTGIGIAQTFVHLDMKARRASWIYKGKGQEAIPVGRELEYV